jgi:hypothetical protein
MTPTIRPLFPLLVAGALGFTAAQAADRKPPPQDIPPPPGLNEAGVETRAAPAAQAEGAAAAATAEDPMAPLPKPDARLVRDKASRDAATTTRRIATSKVTTRHQGTDTVEEYRENGRIWMIKIVPQRGPTQTFMDTDGSGRLARDPNEGPVSPVYYTLYEWK